MGSEPSLFNTKLHSNLSENKHYKTHNSDSEISRIEHEMEHQVIFTLGEDTLLKDLEETTRLVRLSSNNGDYVSKDTVKKICTDITDFCLVNNIEGCCEKNTNNDEIHEAYDVAEHMDSLNEKLNLVRKIDSAADVNGDVDGLACAKSFVEDIVIHTQVNLDVGDQNLEESKDVVDK